MQEEEKESRTKKIQFQDLEDRNSPMLEVEEEKKRSFQQELDDLKQQLRRDFAKEIKDLENEIKSLRKQQQQQPQELSDEEEESVVSQKVAKSNKAAGD